MPTTMALKSTQCRKPVTGDRGRSPAPAAALRALAASQPFGPIQAKLAVGPAHDRFEAEADHIADRIVRTQDAAASGRTAPLTISPIPVGQSSTQSVDSIIQPRLRVGPVDDPLEREAHRVADHVMGRQQAYPVDQAAPTDQSVGHHVQRLCTDCEEELHRQPSGEEDEERLQRHNDTHAPPEVDASFESRIQSLAGGGEPLATSLRAFYEPRFGADFSQVRVHTGFPAAEAARSLRAHAFTVGRDIVFDDGQYAPETEAGKWLLAHELTHTVQQAQGTERSPRTLGPPRYPSGPAANLTPSISHRKPIGVQRLVRRTSVACPAGQNPFSADRRAVTLLTNAIARIDTAIAERAANPTNADVVAVSNAMRTAFRLNPANDDHWTMPAPHFGLLLIRRRLEIARDYINSVVFTFNCCAPGAACAASACGTCNAGTEAFVCNGEPSTIQLCPPFWAHGVNQRGRVLVHEVLHINFGFIEDWGQPGRANAHCYAQFTALLNGFNSPAGFRCH